MAEHDGQIVGVPQDGGLEDPSRRQFMVQTGATVGVVGFLGVEGVGTAYASEPDQSNGEGEHPTTPGPEEHAEEAQGGEEHHISLPNVLSAAAVTGVFYQKVRDNVRYEQTHGREGQAFGGDSFKHMAVAETVRMGVLQVAGDKEQRDHEALDLAISYALLGVLVNVAEATNHLEADERRIFDKIKTIGEGLDEEQIQMPDLSAEAGEWESYLESKKGAVKQVIGQNVAISTVMAPCLTTYTSAALVNANNHRLSQYLAEMKYAEQITTAKQVPAEPIDVNTSTDYMNTALDFSNEAMNGEWGYVRMQLVLAGNIQGAGFLGDPPNFFYLKNNPASEFLQTSLEGIALGMGQSAWMHGAWMKKHLGSGFMEELRTAGDAFKKGWNIVTAGFKTLGVLDHAILRNKKFADGLAEELERVQVESDHDLAPEHLALLQQKLRDMKRAPFSFYGDGYKEAFIGLIPSADRQMLRTLRASEELHEGGVDSVGELHNLQDLISQAPDKLAFVRDLMRHYDVRLDSDIARQLSDVLTKLVKDNAFDPEQDGVVEPSIFTSQDKEFLDRVKVSADTDREELHDEFLQELIVDIQEGNVNDINELLDRIGGRTILTEEGLRWAVESFWAENTGADTVDHRVEAGGLSHNSKEVLSALATQILEANSMAVLIKKALELVGDKMPLEAKTAMVQVLGEGLSGVADNVVAYVLIETVLQDLYKQELGEDVFEREGGKKLLQSINSAAILCAIAGGALTRIGNGPGMTFEQPVAMYRNGEVVAEYQNLSLAESAKNPWAWVAGGSTLALTTARIKYATGGVAPAAETTEHASAVREENELDQQGQSRQPNQMTRRTLLRSLVTVQG